MLICKGCKIEFTPKRKGQEYHNRNCFIKSTVRLVICPRCGIKFKKNFSGQICCSPECAYAYRAKNQIKGKSLKCTFCSKPIYKMQSRVRKRNFCDNFCTIAYLRSPQNISMSKGWNHTEEAKQKIKQANLNRNYDLVFTKKTRQKLRENARNTILRKDVKEKTRLLNRKRLTGTTLPEETRLKIIAHAKYGKDNFMYKDSPSYYAKHIWVNGHKGRAGKCVDKTTGTLPCKGRFEWSNVDHKYRRNLDDYSERCTRHHRIYDIQHGLTHPKGKAKRFFAKAEDWRIRTFTIDGIITPKASL